jgi:hypothetical protein
MTSLGLIRAERAGRETVLGRTQGLMSSDLTRGPSVGSEQGTIRLSLRRMCFKMKIKKALNLGTTILTKASKLNMRQGRPSLNQIFISKTQTRIRFKSKKIMTLILRSNSDGSGKRK